MAKYNNILEIDNQNPQMQELKSGAPKFLTEEQETKLKEVITLNTPDNVGFPNRKKIFYRYTQQEKL